MINRNESIRTDQQWCKGLQRLGLVLFSVSFLAACSSLSPREGFSGVESSVKSTLDKEVRWLRSEQATREVAARVESLLSTPLSLENAVQIALLNNRDLQAAYEQLGIALAERDQAGRIPNPGFSFGKSKQGDERETEYGLHFNLARLIFMPTVIELETRRLARTQKNLTSQVIDLAAQTRKAWINAVSAKESANYMSRVKRTADVGAQLARRMAAIGNFSKLQQAREQSFYADAVANQARARHAAVAAKEHLTRLLGLFGNQVQFTLPDRLPSLPDEPKAYPEAVKTALGQRLDVQAAKDGVAQLASNLGMARTNRFVNVLELGLMSSSSNSEPKKTGWEIKFELPLFDWGGAKVAKADAMYRQAMHEAAQIAIDARSEVRLAYNAYRTTFDIAKHYRDEVIPLRMRISEENQYRYNGMFISVFELLADARSQISSVNQYIQALRDFWIAQADLDMAMLGKPNLTSMSGPNMAETAGDAGGH